MKDTHQITIYLQKHPGTDSWKRMRRQKMEKVQHFLESERGVAFEFFRSTGENKECILQTLMLAKTATNSPIELEAIHIIMTELIQNGIKANFKKAFFLSKGIIAENEDEYREALPDFKIEIARNTDFLAGMSMRAGMSVRLQIFALKSNSIKLRVINNTRLYPIEAERIKEKMEHALRYKTLMDFLSEQQDETEGSGMGIFLITHTLKSMGLSLNHFGIFQNEHQETVASVLFSW